MKNSDIEDAADTPLNIKSESQPGILFVLTEEYKMPGCFAIILLYPAP